MMVDSQHFAVKEIGAMHDQVARDFLEKQQQKEAVAQRTAGAQRRLQELLAQRERAEHQVARGEEQLQLESEEVAALKTQKDGVARKAEAMKQADVQHTARRQQAQRAYLERLYARSDQLAAERERAAEQGQRRDSLLADVRAHLDRFEGAVGALEQNDSFDMLHLGVDKGLFEHALEHFANFERSLGAEEATVA